MSFKIYKSSAGSGKTFTLVYEYLKLALQSDTPKRYKSIMAVTFTNKAANEMKDRVIKYLTAISKNQASKGSELLIKEKLLQEFNVSEQVLEVRAKKTLQSILHEYSDFNISTIDKFILKIIRSFATDFDIPMNFDIEMDSDAITRMAVENLISSAGTNKDNTEFLLEYVKQQSEDDADWSISEALISFSNKVLDDNSSKYLQGIKKFSFQDFLSSKKKCHELYNNYVQNIDALLKKGAGILAEENVEADDLVGKSQGIWKYFCTPTPDSEFEPTTSKMLSNFEKDDWAHPKATTRLSEKSKQELYELFHKIEELKSIEMPKAIAAKQISGQLFQLALINEIEKEISALKKEFNFVQISEFNERVAEIVVQQPVPFIYERIGEKFENYLIDEFQDTSELQWQNLMPLIENSLAYNRFNLLVGDVKQAIYRWRGGNAEQFQNIENEEHFTDNPIVNERLLNIRRNIERDTLATNYRSLPNIIKFNNLFFEKLLPALSMDFKSTYYSDYQQKIGTDKKGGYAEIHLRNKEIDENQDEFNLSVCLSIIEDCLARGYNYQDIAILSRTNTLSKVVGEHLVSHNIPILSSSSLSLSQSTELNFIMSVFKLVNTPNDYSSIISILEFVCSEEELSHQQFIVFKNKYEAHQKLREYLLKEHQITLPSIHNVGLYDAIESIIRLFQLDKNDPFIQKFLDICNASQENDSLEFIQWWEEKKEKTFISSPENINAVQLLTIHKSKGLEFPVVIYPFANRGKGPNNNLIWTETKNLPLEIPYSIVKHVSTLEKSTFAEAYLEEKKQILLDDLNNAYVCLTRAVEELYIVAEDKDKRKTSDINDLTGFFYPVLEHLESDNQKYFLGEKTFKKTNTLVAAGKEFLVEENQNWKEKIKLSFNAPSIWNVPLSTEDEFTGKDPRKNGNLIHSVFARITNTKDLPQVIEKMVQQGFIEKTAAENIKRSVNEVLSIDFVQQIWDKGVHLVEQEIITNDGKSYRPDRIISLEDKTYLIDFKTGEKSKKDIKQIEHYATLLKELEYTNIQKYLIYISPFELMAID